MRKLHSRLIKLCALAAMAFFVGMSAPASAQHQGHEHMPGMDMSKPKPKPTPRQKSKPAPSTKKDTRHDRHDMHDMHNRPGMEGTEHETPQPTPTGESAPSAQTEAAAPNSPPAAAPASSAAPMKMDEPRPAANPAMIDSAKPAEEMHGMHMHDAKDASPSAEHNMNSMKGMSTNSGNMSGMGSMNMGPLMVMSSSDMGIRVGSSENNVLRMGQMGSGTSWTPGSTPMHMYHKVTGDWLLMFHGEAKIGVNAQGGPRGVAKFESMNWLMPMAFHKLGRGTLGLRGMFSLEPFTFPPGGSPLLFQTGESYKGQPLIDKQHPHDLFMELATTYTMPIGERATWFAYFGYPGEPALGPTAFMHRWSASENPSAPLSHHLQDSTHISFGVLTTGLTYRWFKLEGSIFNGREPGENRYNFEAHPWNSRSARLSFAPNSNWSMQISHGFLRKPEALEPGDIHRTTASIHYNKPFNRGNWASSLIWGRNHVSSPDDIHNLNGYTAESTVNFLDKNYLYTRLELVDKNELLRAVDRARLRVEDEHPSFRIGAYTFGGARDIWNTDKLSIALGSDVTFYSMPSVLNPIYGSNPASFRVFMRLRPSKMNMSSHGNMHGNTHGNMDHTGHEVKESKQ